MRILAEIVAEFVLRQAEDDVPRDITGPEIILAGPEPFPWGWVVAAALAIAILGVFLWAYFQKPRMRRTRASDRALRQLDRLQKLQLLAKGQAERHFTLLAGIVRRFVEKGYGIAAARLSSSEFLEAATRNPLLERHLTFLREFFTASDIAKFAPPAAIVALGRDLDDQVRTWLASQSTTEKAPRT